MMYYILMFFLPVNTLISINKTCIKFTFGLFREECKSCGAMDEALASESKVREIDFMEP